MLFRNSMLKAYKSLFILFTLLLVFTSCKKFDEGGYLIRTKKNLAQTWVIDKYFIDNVDRTSELTIKNYSIQFSKDNSFVTKYIDDKEKEEIENGSWELYEKEIHLSGNSSITLIDSEGSISSSYIYILKLDSDEFWYQFENGSNSHTIKLKTND
jgi:hypothetical protein